MKMTLQATAISSKKKNKKYLVQLKDKGEWNIGVLWMALNSMPAESDKNLSFWYVLRKWGLAKDYFDWIPTKKLDLNPFKIPQYSKIEEVFLFILIAASLDCCFMKNPLFSQMGMKFFTQTSVILNHITKSSIFRNFLVICLKIRRQNSVRLDRTFQNHTIRFFDSLQLL